MFNLIMKWFQWEERQASMHLNRMFEYTEDSIAEDFKEGSQPLLKNILKLPCLFMNEGTDDDICHVGRIIQARIVNNEIRFEYAIDIDIPPIENKVIYANRISLDMPHDFEFHRNHWAIKDVDLYRFLLTKAHRPRQRPIVFRIEEHEQIEPTLVSVMMPFDTSFNSVYESIRAAAENIGLRCRRADDIWENPMVIQDVVSLLDHARIVVCDCSNRNPNVFYEVGIAHTLGREVILITQSELDIPFDLRHLRYMPYLNNGEGRRALSDALQARMQTIIGH